MFSPRFACFLSSCDFHNNIIYRTCRSIGILRIFFINSRKMRVWGNFGSSDRLMCLDPRQNMYFLEEYTPVLVNTGSGLSIPGDVGGGGMYLID